MNHTLEANSIFLNPTHTECRTNANKILKSCYDSLDLLENMKGEIGVDQFNYIQEYFNRIIMIITSLPTQNNGTFNVFAKPYVRDNLNELPITGNSFTLNSNLQSAEYANQTLSVPAEYKILTTLDKQLAYNKFGERIVVPFVDNIKDPLSDAINASQYIAGNGLDISRHIKPMSLNKYK